MKQLILFFVMLFCTLGVKASALSIADSNTIVVSKSEPTISKPIKKKTHFWDKYFNKPNVDDEATYTNSSGYDLFAIWCSILMAIGFVTMLVGVAISASATVAFLPILVFIAGICFLGLSFIAGIISLVRFFIFKKMKGRGFLFANIGAWLTLLIGAILASLNQ